MADAGQRARHRVKGAIAVERGCGNAAERGEYGKIVSDDQCGARGMALSDALYRVPRPPVDLRKALPARDLQLGRGLSPTADKGRVLRFDFVKSESLQKSVIEFAKVVINEDGKIAMVAADDLGSLNRPLHRTRIDSGEWLLAQDAANLLSLGQSGTVKVE